MKRKRKRTPKVLPPENQVESLLAAPDAVRKGGDEYRKVVQRKAREEAERKRLARCKAVGTPTTEDLLADIIRVADDQETNPFWRFRSISRRRYELYGWFDVKYVDQTFGQFEHAKQVAGLSDQPGTRLWRAARAEASRREHAQRYVERYVRPYVADGSRRIDDAYLLLSISDLHPPYLDPFTWVCFLRAIRDLRPDGVLFNGDIIDGSEISRFPKIPGWTVPLQLEFDFVKEMIRQIREDARHDGDLWVCGGNHDIDRLVSYLTQTESILTRLDSVKDTLRFDKLLGLEEHAVRLMSGGTILSPKGEEDAKPGFLLFDFYRVHHGTRLGQYPAHAELRDAGRSGQSGHVHRAQLAYGTTERDAGLSWMCTPCACSELASRAYIKGTTEGWQRGFGIAWLFPDQHVHQYPIVTDGRYCHVEGYAYERGSLPNPDVTKLWLKELSL